MAPDISSHATSSSSIEEPWSDQGNMVFVPEHKNLGKDKL